MGYGGVHTELPLPSPLQVHKFLDKNHDQVRQDVLDLFVRSRTRVSKPRRPGPLEHPVHRQTPFPA